MQFLRIEDVADKVSFKKSHIWALVNHEIFPKPIEISARITVWDRDDIQKNGVKK